MFQLIERQSNMIAYNTIFRVLGWMFLMLIPFILIMRRPSTKAPPAPMH
jgi:hypothetical protein